MTLPPDISTQAADDLGWLLDPRALAKLGDPLPPVLYHPQSLPEQFAACKQQINKQPNIPLGRYAELLLADWLNHLPRVEQLTCNRIIKLARRTLGEFDFLFRLQGEQNYTHLEFCIKFYLGKSTEDGTRWYGLNPNDRLDLKLERLRNHQLALSRVAAVREQLEQEQIRIARRSGLMAGILFYPLDERLDDCESATPEHRRGWWCYASQWQPKETHYRILQHRRDWLSGANPEIKIDAAETIRHQGLRHPVMISEGCQETGGKWIERQRGVLVPDHWPGRPPPPKTAGV